MRSLPLPFLYFSLLLFLFCVCLLVVFFFFDGVTLSRIDHTSIYNAFHSELLNLCQTLRSHFLGSKNVSQRRNSKFHSQDIHSHLVLISSLDPTPHLVRRTETQIHSNITIWILSIIWTSSNSKYFLRF